MENEMTLRQSVESRLTALKTSPEQYCASLRPVTVNDVFLSHEPDIGTVIRKYGQPEARAILVFLIADMLEFFNATESMSDTQVAMTIDLIIEEYPYFKTDDFKLCFKNAMKMKYGKLYNRIDGRVIMGWLKEYNKERCAMADHQSYNEHKAHLAEDDKPMDGIFYSDYRERLKERSENGDKEARERLRLSDEINAKIQAMKVESRREDLLKFYEKEEARKQAARKEAETRKEETA